MKKQNTTRRLTRPANRRGITLLFVISMIVLFLLMGATFVIVSNDYLRNARRRGRMDIKRDSGPALVDRAFYDLFRGPDLFNTTSPLRGHSLLADMYGYGMKSEVATVATHPSGHFISLTIDQRYVQTIIDSNLIEITGIDTLGVPVPMDINPAPGLYNGLLLSFVDGAANGLTTRIVDHQVIGDANVGSTGYEHTFILQPVWSDAGVAVTDIAVGDTIIINGRPFSGPGAGFYQPTTAYNDPTLGVVNGTVPSALQPNQLNRTRAELLTGTAAYDGYLARQVGAVPFSNSNAPAESYDALDFQNMFLAGLNPDGTVVKGSFDRPELVTYVTANYGAPASLRADFREFVGQGLVVDNDGDGNPDGIWMDTGLPIQSDDSGRYFKPMVSYLCVDMDGKFNVNANGDLVDVQANQFNLTYANMIGQLPAPAFIPPNRGAGYGPPEVNMTPLFGVATAANLLSGNAAYNGRYGVDDLPGVVGRDAWSEYKLFGYPNVPPAGTFPQPIGNHFFSAMDIHGRYAFGYPQVYDDKVDFTFPVGLPISDVTGTAIPTSELADSAYEMNFAPSPFSARSIGGVDQPYSPEEAERVLRMFDRDAFMMPQRLYELGGGAPSWSSGATSRRHSFTTDSWEVPTTFDNLASSLYQILDANIVAGPTKAADIRSHIIGMLPPEILAGLPMDINRPFGDGTDFGGGNGVIDDTDELTTDRLAHPNGTGPYLMDHVSDTTQTDDLDAALARATFARHLYIVTLLTTEWVDKNGDGLINDLDWFDFNNDGVVNNDDKIEYRRRIAQWAINVVDFRDPDSIMTPFEVDLNPWNGWQVNGDIANNPASEVDRYVYWGCERPDLLITETFASHDRRTQDSPLDGTGPYNNGVGTDDDFDSHLVPNVSAFFELYNPWVQNAANQILPGETADNIAPGARTGVFLQKTVPGTADEPVFRLVVTEYDPNNIDLNDPHRNVGALPTVNRRIYFTQPNVAIDSGPQVYYPDAGITVGAVQPGRYAVVGSAGVRQVGNRYDTYLGRTNTNVPLVSDVPELENDTRRISLNPTANEVEIVNWDGAAMSTTTRTDVVALPIGVNNGTPRNLGISDPLLGYDPAVNPALAAAQLVPVEDGFKYATAADPMIDHYFDTPVDETLQPTMNQATGGIGLSDDGIEWNNPIAAASGLSAYRSVYLQRLANPMIAYNAVTNPYITIDYNSVDVIRFNGVDASNDPHNDAPQTMRVGSLERRSNENTTQQNQESAQSLMRGRYRMLFKSDLGGKNPANASDTPVVLSVPTHVMSRNVEDSLGYLNDAYIGANPNPVDPNGFAWLQWNNRPYISQMELANVPMESQFWMMSKFDVSDTTRNVYMPPMEDDPGAPDITGAENYAGHFGHLLNFYSDQTDDPGTPGIDFSPWLFRVMDYLEVPSRFIGTESRTNPDTFDAANPWMLSRSFAPPFDSISNYRYPGKININTVYDDRVWAALMGNYSDPTIDALNDDSAVTYAEWNASRQLGAGNPTDYGNPYRGADAFNNVPVASMVVDPAGTGLFRREEGGTDTPLFDYDSSPVPALGPLTYNNTDRSAYHKYDMRQRMGNMVTGRSSVFAIWVTIGYFEVDANGDVKGSTVQAVNRGTYPAAFEAPAEIGWETGEIKRNRGFYMIDRSIPVAFEPGKNHNVERAILTKSYIE